MGYDTAREVDEETARRRLFTRTEEPDPRHGWDSAPESSADLAYPLPADSAVRGRGYGTTQIAAIRHLQQSHGNRAVQRFLQRSAQTAGMLSTEQQPDGTAQSAAATASAGSPIAAEQPGSPATATPATLQSVSERAAFNALYFTQQVAGAVETFQAYALSRLPELEGTVSAAALAGSLAQTVHDSLGAVRAPEEPAELAKQLEQATVGQLLDAVDDRTQAAATNQDTLSALRRAVTALGEGTQVAAGQVQAGVAQQLDPALAALAGRARGSAELSPGDQAFLAAFAAATPEAFDAGLERNGILGPQQVEQVRAQLLADLVRVFDQYRAAAEAGGRGPGAEAAPADATAGETPDGQDAGQTATAPAGLKRANRAGG